MDNVHQKVTEIFQTHNIPDTFIDSKQKFTILNECFKIFSHSVPNSCLNEMKTIGELTFKCLNNELFRFFFIKNHYR